MFIVICYDIENDKRRTRVHKALKMFGVNVQKSVFEAIVDGGQLRQMQQTIQPLIDRSDKVRYYTLCEGCRQKVTGTRGHPSATLPRPIII